MSIHETEHGTWRVRWRDLSGRQQSRTFKTRALAASFEAQREAGVAEEPTPLWRRMLERTLGTHAAIDVASLNPHGHFVYLLWGASDDRPLYVGRSSNVLARLGAHLNNPGRRHRVARVTLIRCYSAEDAAETEAQLIDAYRCELNLLDGAGRPRRCAPPPPDVHIA